jgi:lipopolysaccharide/colanic/teichoic acid biosynthesis glycosyltransferase
LTVAGATLKRGFDVVLAAVLLLAFWWLIVLAAIVARLDTRRSGFFVQDRIGRNGEPFQLIKIRTMRQVEGIEGTVTAESDVRITKVGRILRRYKIDEMPQLINILKGDMSFVGPRPDVSGFADTLEGEDRVILAVRPGLTGPASLKYKDEERLLASVDNPERFNKEVIWPDKVKINRGYIQNWRFRDDLVCLFRTIIG